MPERRLGVIECVRLADARRAQNPAFELLAHEVKVCPSPLFGWRVYDEAVGLDNRGTGWWRLTAGLALRKAQRIVAERLASGDYVFDEPAGEETR